MLLSGLKWALSSVQGQPSNTTAAKSPSSVICTTVASQQEETVTYQREDDTSEPCYKISLVSFAFMGGLGLILLMSVLILGQLGLHASPRASLGFHSEHSHHANALRAIHDRPSSFPELVPVDPHFGSKSERVEGYVSLGEVRRAIALACIASLLLLLLAATFLVPRPLRRLSSLLEQLQDLDVGQCAGKLRELRAQGPSCIQEVRALEGIADRLTRSLDAFGRFIPLPIVQAIASGDEASMQLNASFRHVTIMFSDVKDFTSISAALDPEKLLRVLTCYFSSMTRIIEACDGTVAEILGDGLLAFWNTPQNVPDHGAQACRAALAQHRALQLLNHDFAALGLPKLSIRIGLHTGDVLSGNLGSNTKMKFGCMGDAVNLSSRLEGLCKHYGVGTICSADTRAALLPEHDFILRRLDTVQVKGRHEATVIYELIGQESACESPPSPAHTIAKVRAQARLYEHALSAYQKGAFPEACALASAALDAHPGDEAASRLLGLATRFLSPAGQVSLSDAELAKWTGVTKMDEK